MELAVVVLFLVVVFTALSNRMLAEQVRMLRARVDRLEATPATPATPATAQHQTLPAPPTTPPPAVPTREIGPAAATQPEHDGVEEPPAWQRMLAEHALAIAGGLFVLVAAVFFVGYAVDQGWIGPGLRITLALAFGAALGAAGLHVASRLPEHERVGQAIGSLHGVLAGVGSGVMFLAVFSAVRVEDVLSAPAGIVLQLLVSLATVQVARRWRSQDLAAFGIVAALASPLVFDAPPSLSTVLLVAVALLGAAVLVVVEHWPRLLAAAALVTAPQLVSFAGEAGATPSIGAVALLGWWLVLAGAAIAESLHRGDAARSSVTTILFAPLVVGAGFGYAYEDAERFASAMITFGVLQLALAGALRLAVDGRIAVLLVSLVGAGFTSVAIAVASIADGAANTVSWTAEAVAMTLLWWLTRSRVSAAFAIVAGLVATIDALAVAAPPTLLAHAGDSLVDPLLATGGLLVGLVALRVIHDRVEHPTAPAAELRVTRRALDLASGFVGWYLVAICLVHAASDDMGSFLLGTWAGIGGIVAARCAAWLRREELAFAAVFALFVEATAFAVDDLGSARVAVTCALLALGALAPLRRDDVADPRGVLLAAASQVLLATAVMLVQLPPSNLRVWGGEPLESAFGFVVAWLLPTIVVGLVAIRSPLRAAHRPAQIGLAIAAVYAISVLVVGVTSRHSGVVEQAPQVALTLTWVAIGVTALLAGATSRLHDQHDLRVGAYALLGVAGAKLVLLDTAELQTPARVLAFLVTGLGLLGAAWLEQRMRRDAT